MTYAILRVNQVIEKTGMKRTYLYQEVKAGRFPKPVNLGAKAIGWIDTEVDAWIQNLIEARNQAARAGNDANVSM